MKNIVNLLIMAIAIPSLSTQLSPVVFMRITAISFIYAGVLTFNTLYIQSIGSGLGIYSGLFRDLCKRINYTFIFLINFLAALLNIKRFFFTAIFLLILINLNSLKWLSKRKTK